MFSVGVDKPLPVLRLDLEIFSGPEEEDGSPTYVVHDPVLTAFNKIGWEEAMVLMRLRRGQTLFALIRELRQQTTLRAKPDEIFALCEDAERHGLTENTLVRPPEELLEALKAKKKSPLGWLIQHYLYFRIPLIRPDALLEKLLPMTRLLVSTTALVFYCLAGLVGLFFLTQRFEAYISTFSYFFNFKGVVAFTAVMMVLKTAHELGHALVAKHYGLRVPTMGVAFMVFFPVAYSDVTDAWRLRHRRARLKIALAGIQVELAVGALAMAGWGLSQPGLFNSVCFILSSTTLISTLLVNLNPAMRYDGYYILSDLWGIDNLSQQSGQFTTWFLRRLLLGLDAPCPIHAVSRRRQFQMIAYTLYAWHYRFFLYLGIALLVYHKFTKPLGIVLFILEIVVFLLHPAIREIDMLRKQLNRLAINRRLLLTVFILLLSIGWAAMPLPRQSEAPAVFLPADSQTIYSYQSGQVIDVLKRRGNAVAPGEVILKIGSMTLQADIEDLTIAVSQLRSELEDILKSADRLGRVPEVKKQLASAEEALAGLQAQQQQLTIKATITGVVAELDEFIRPGCYVKGNQVIGKIVASEGRRIDAFVSETDATHMVSGKKVMFYPQDRSKPVPGTIEGISPIREDSAEVLDIGSLAIKTLPLTKDGFTDRLIFVESYYKVQIAPLLPTNSNLRLGTSGYIRYHTIKQSLAARFIEYCYTVFIRESSL